MRALLCPAAALVLAACAAAPAPQRIEMTLPERFAQASATEAQPVAEFWRAFGDTELDALVGEAVQANRDLRAAAERVAEARALAEGTLGLGRPSLELTSSVARTRERQGDAAATSRNSFGIGLASVWEVDLLGHRIANEQRAAQARQGVSEANARGAQVSVAAEVARSYFELRGLQEQLRLTRLDLSTQRDALKLVEARLEAGRGTALDTERARAFVEGTAAGLPALESALARARMRLAVLCGRPPSAFDDRLAAQKPLPGLPATPLAAIGSPQTLLQRRPDVAAAEQALRAADAQSGIARSRLYPELTLAGSLGLNAGRIGDLGNAGTFVANLGASVLWSLVDNGQRRAQIGAADARQAAAQAQFDQTVLAALEETEAAFVTFTRTQERSTHLFAAATAAEGAARIARARFAAGSIDFLVLLDAERELLLARDRLAQGQTQAALALVGVYRVLAGGWR